MDPQNYPSEPLQKAPSQRMAFATVVLLTLACLSGAMLFMAVPNLVGGDPWSVGIKSILLATSGVLISYAVNKLAVERGAPLAVLNYTGAAIVSVLSIAVVGIGLFSATYAGLVIKDVDQLVVYEHGEALSKMISEETAVAAEARGVVPTSSAILGELQLKLDCEIAESCISGRGNGGNGPVARALLEKLGRAQALYKEVQAGESAREDAINDLTELYAQYREAASRDAGLAAKRNGLADLDLQIKQAATRVREALPLELLRAYAEELRSGVDIPGRPESAAKLSAIFDQHGASLSRVLETIPSERTSSPAFPKAPGVTDTFVYIGHFLPVAAIAAVVELVFPISLWLYTYFARSWAIWQVAPPEQRRIDPEEAELQILLAAPRRRDANGGRNDPHPVDEFHPDHRNRHTGRPSLTPRGRRDH